MRMMKCEHNGFHDTRSAYDARRGVLVFFWTCAQCGAQLKEARREEYRPSFNRHGNDKYLTAAAT